MEPDARRRQIITLIEEKKFVTINYLTRHLFSSEATIRRDLNCLEKEGYIKRTRGGALSIKEYYQEQPFDYKTNYQVEQKKYIADIAIDFIGSFQSVFMDSSSTCIYLARKMVSINNLTVLSNGLSTCCLLSENEQIRVHCPGGSILSKRNSIVGTSTVEYISNHFADIAFVSCRGLDAAFGASDFVKDVTDLKKAFRTHCGQMVLLADSSKFRKKFFFQSLLLNDIDVIITDTRPPEDMMNAFKEADIEVIY